MALAYPFRGQTWTITQRREGLDVIRDDGFGATLRRVDGSLWFHVTPQKAIIRATARSGGPGRLSVSNTGKQWSAVRVNGKPIVPNSTDGRWVFDLPDLAAPGVEVELDKP